jgi:eukaryotic-like serine/threonine-protein kinase
MNTYRKWFVLVIFSLATLAFVFFVAYQIHSQESRKTSVMTAGFRGDVLHSGVYKSKELKNFGGVQWVFQTGGAVRSSPTIANGVLYIGSTDGFLYAIDSERGDEGWRFNANRPITSTPAVTEDTVYFTTRESRLFALDIKSGKLKWQLKTGTDAPLAWGHESGDFFTSSPTVADDKIFFGGGDGNLYAVDAKSGKELWRFKTGWRIRSSPAVEAGIVYFGSFDGKLYAVETESGKIRWKFDTEGVNLNSADFGYDRRSIQSSPVVVQHAVLFGARDGFLYAVEKQTGKLRWRIDHNISWVNCSPAAANGVAYAGSSDGRFVQAVEIASGKEIWRTKTDSLVWSSPSVAGQTLYFGDWAGNFYAMNRTNGTELWRFRIQKRILSSPAIENEKIFFGADDGAVYALNSGNEKSLQRAVFWDEEYSKGSSIPHEAVRDFFKNSGYEVLNSLKLAEFLSDRNKDHLPSVVVFAIDHLPKTIISDDYEASLFKKYLQGGGKILWIGKPPMLWDFDLQTGERALKDLKRDEPGKLLGVSHLKGNFDLNTAWATKDGNKWGLNGWWLSDWSASPEDVTSVLAEDEQGLTAAWVKNYGGATGTGFVRLPIGNTVKGIPSNLLQMRLVAEYLPR